jgi:DNA invertase Pin-like site-specific DNA recombinase
VKQLGRLLVAGIGLGIGHEIGRALFLTSVRILNKDGREQIKTRYREGLKEAEKNGKTIRLVHEEGGLRVVNNETPTTPDREQKMRDLYESDRQRVNDMHEDGN